jgi:hypothetical protein
MNDYRCWICALLVTSGDRPPNHLNHACYLVNGNAVCPGHIVDVASFTDPGDALGNAAMREGRKART